MATKSEVEDIIKAIQATRFSDAHHLMTSSTEPTRLQATVSLIYMAELGFQLNEIATELRRINRGLGGQQNLSLP
jgi:xanthine dehydrogenase molybdopterin-binding subunit B